LIQQALVTPPKTYKEIVKSKSIGGHKLLSQLVEDLPSVPILLKDNYGTR